MCDRMMFENHSPLYKYQYVILNRVNTISEIIRYKLFNVGVVEIQFKLPNPYMFVYHLTFFFEEK